MRRGVGARVLGQVQMTGGQAAAVNCVAVVYADPSYAAQELGWRAELGLEQMCSDSWNWISNNPNGFNEA